MSEIRFQQRRLTALLAAVLLALLTTLTACGDDTTGSTKDAPAATQAAPTTRTVTDMSGNKVEVPSRPMRVVTNYPAVTQIIFLLGAIERQVGVTQTNLTTLPLFKKIYPPLAQKTAVFGTDTTTVNTEVLLAQKPDLVLLTAGNDTLRKTITDLGIPAVDVASFPNSDKLSEGVTFIADVLGGDAPARAKKFTEFYDGTISRAAEGTKGLTDAERPKIYYTADNPLSTDGSKTIAEVWARQGGGVAVTEGGSVSGTAKPVTLEAVVAWNPDYIFCRDHTTCEEILKDDRFAEVAAVRNHHVITNPRGVFVWSARSAESALQPLWVAKTLHPDKFADVDIEKEVKEFYTTFYNYKLTDAEVDGILAPTEP
ncbi:iron complex transport system substrate-binding protein [Parafrankia irregularis]|uniref:Iron complex transport system substrate-binding protein n=1 Tax=Parafrankia irregularis TaxID=795642 RepID=A0A0S4QJ11_9ACTN|nr:MULTISPECIES: ABC transporter substrate-binding protein [Parafrankia]MBE3203831.1 ABC transporter substrate-binding protein [Parafrankia sp. CH37]CUU55300.1 iron complex transport system substrate-binding protein [Parafrankia irregularis]